MKKLIFCLLLGLMTTFVFAQTDNYKTVMEHFQSSYNAGQYEAIFNSFSGEMKAALPLESTKEFLTGLKSQFGKIESKEFVGYQQDTYATYKTNFERMTLAVNISLDEENHINGFFIKPYEEPAVALNTSVNALQNFPEEISKAIFSRTKIFPNNVQLSIAVIQNGKANYYGIVKVNDTIKPAENQQKIFEIGSITKVFTSTVLASLVEEGKLKLEDDINSYYSFKFKDGIRISFESLANHTSGLPRLPVNLDLSNEINPYNSYGKKEVEDYLKNLLKLEKEPLTVSSYSNLGTGILGYTLGLSQKTSFQKLLQQRVFDKYKMKNSFTSSQNLGDRLVKGLDKDGKVVGNWDFDVLFGAGGILATTEDLVKFANAQFDSKNKELSLTRKPTFDVSETMKIGLGWHLIPSKNGSNLIWHNGGTGGYSSSMAVNVEEKTAVIILSNVSDINDDIDALCFELMSKR